jgi:hypothetical protein
VANNAGALSAHGPTGGVNDRQSGVNAARGSARSLRPSFMSDDSRSRLTESSEFGGPAAPGEDAPRVFNLPGSTNSPLSKATLGHLFFQICFEVRRVIIWCTLTRGTRSSSPIVIASNELRAACYAMKNTSNSTFFEFKEFAAAILFSR